MGLTRFDDTTTPPRIASQGFIPARPAGPAGRINRRAMLISKPRKRREVAPGVTEGGLSWLAGKMGPAERWALREIAQAGDLAEVNGKTYLVAHVPTRTSTPWPAFEAEGEDREPGADGESSLGQSHPLELADLEHDTSDEESDHDNEPSIC